MVGVTSPYHKRSGLRVGYEHSKWSEETANFLFFVPLRKLTYGGRNVSKSARRPPAWPKRFKLLSTSLRVEENLMDCRPALALSTVSSFVRV